jgi:hypothetical protein
VVVWEGGGSGGGVGGGTSGVGDAGAGAGAGAELGEAGLRHHLGEARQEAHALSRRVAELTGEAHASEWMAAQAELTSCAGIQGTLRGRGADEEAGGASGGE